MERGFVKTLVLVNPRAGNHRGGMWLSMLRERVRALGLEALVRVQYTRPEALEDQVRDEAKGMERLAVVGGDGTISQVLEAMWRSRLSIPVGIVPLGTGNDLARSLGLYRGRAWGIGEAVDYLKTPRTRPLDLWSIQDRACFSNYASVGLDAAVVRRFCRLRKWIHAHPLLGRRGFYFAMYIVVWAGRITQRVPLGSRLTWVDETGRTFHHGMGGARVLALSNTPYYAAGALMDEEAELGDGLLEVTLFPNMRHYAELMATRAKPARRLGLQRRWWRVRARSLEIHLGSSSPIQADGEDITDRLGEGISLEVQRRTQMQLLVW